MGELGSKRKPTSFREDWPVLYKTLWLTFPLCSECGRKMRPAKGTSAQYPETVAMMAGALCHSCYMLAGKIHARREAKRLAQLGVVELARPTRAVYAEAWQSPERSAALLVCGRFAPPDAAEFLDMLGLFSLSESVMGGRASLQI